MQNAMCTAISATATQATDQTRVAAAAATGTDIAEPTEAAAAEAVAAEHNIGIRVPPALAAANAAGYGTDPPTPPRAFADGISRKSASPSKINQAEAA